KANRVTLDRFPEAIGSPGQNPFQIWKRVGADKFQRPAGLLAFLLEINIHVKERHPFLDGHALVSFGLWRSRRPEQENDDHYRQNGGDPPNLLSDLRRRHPAPSRVASKEIPQAAADIAGRS